MPQEQRNSQNFLPALEPSETAIVRDEGFRERRRGEKALRESVERLTTAARAAKIGVFECNHGTGIFETSPTFRLILGFAEDTVITVEKVIDRIHPEDQEFATAEIYRAWNPEGDGLTRTEHRITHPDGIRWVQVRSETIFQGEGEAKRPARTIGVVLDISREKQAELELESSRQQLRTAISAAKLGIWSRDVTTNVVTADTATRAIFGWSPDQHLTSETFAECIVPEDRQRYLDQLALCEAQHSSTLKIDYRIQLPDGVIRWVCVWGHRLRDKPGKVLWVTGVVQDITELKRTELELISGRHQLRAAVEAAKLGIWSLDLQTGLISGDAVAISIHGVTSDEVTEESLLERIVPEDREKFSKRHEAAAVGQSSGEILEYRLRLPNGHVRWVATWGDRICDTHGKPVLMTGVLQDITARKEAEIELAVSRQQLQAALGVAHLGLWTYNLSSTVLTCDALARSILGWPPECVVTIDDLITSVHPDERERFAEQCKSLSCGELESTEAVEQRIERPDGEIRWVTVRRNLIRDPAGHPSRMIGVIRDVTRRKQAELEKLALEQQFLHSQKMEAVGRLAGGVAHDFNNLLMVIRSYAELMQFALPEQDKLQRNVRAIMQASDRAAHLTGQMLAFSRKQILSPVPHVLNAPVADAANMLRRLIGEDIELRVSTNSTWTVRADPGQTGQVLMNLGVNARDAMPNGGTLTIKTADVNVAHGSAEERAGLPPGDYGVISVTDSGTGITKEVKERMFEPFFTTKGVGKGTGLGLSTVYGIVKQSGGYMLVESEPGQGATFTIYLPRVDEAPISTALMNAEWAPGGNETLLIVEEEDALRASVTDFLGDLGYTVLCADCGRQALEVAVTNPSIDLMVTAVAMPKMSGRSLAQLLWDEQPSMKTIFISSYTEDAIAQHSQEEEETTLLQKPFSLADLARKIREVLDRHENIGSTQPSPNYCNS